MEKFRIGNDLAICWAIVGDDGRPFPLADKTVRVFLTHPRGRTEITADISVQDNVIVWNFAAIKQRYLGTYKLTVEIYSPLNIRVTKRDINEAFALVSDSLYEDIESGKPDINETGMLRLSSVLEVIRISPIIPQIGENGNWFVDGVDTGKPAKGADAYEIAVDRGYNGSYEEYAKLCADIGSAVFSQDISGIIIMKESEYDPYADYGNALIGLIEE